MSSTTQRTIQILGGVVDTPRTKEKMMIEGV